MAQSNFTGNTPLSKHDPELFGLIQEEKKRQVNGLEMIASENFTSRAVMECLGSCLTNKYSEGYPGARYYGGNDVIDKIESLAKKRALDAFGIKDDDWAVNVQPYSGSPANFAVYTGLLQPHDRIMGLELTCGGHLTHGFYAPVQGGIKCVSATSMFWDSLPYRTNSEGWIDYEGLQNLANTFRPKIIISGHSAYPRVLDFKKFREIADSVGALLMCDMAHIGGLVAAGVHPSPFELCDIVTTTTHKTLRGPRAGIIWSRKKSLKDGSETGFATKIDQAVFPGLQGGPHEHQIAAIATQLKEVMSPEFKTYGEQVVKNARALGDALTKKGYKLATGGTDNHLVLWDVRPFDLTGSKVEKLLDLCNITVNKNTIVGDKSAITPGGVRIGTPSLTTRGMVEKDMEHIAEWFDRAIKISVEIQKKAGKKINDFADAAKASPEVQAMAKEVEEFAAKYPMPGIDESTK